MKVVVVGPGSIGLLFYGLLSRSKEDVWLLDKNPERAVRLKKNGIRIEGVTTAKISTPRITSDPKEVADANLWVICVKSYDTKNIVKILKDHLAPSAVALSIQNGVGNLELLSEQLGSSKVLAGVTNLGAYTLEEGHIKHAGDGETVVGRRDGSMGVEVRSIRELFNKAKMSLKITRDVQSVLWSKLVVNVGINALAALTHLPNGQLLEHEGCRRIFKDAITEAVKVAKRKRIKLLYDDPVSRASNVCEATADNISSTLLDVLRSKKTEIDSINGAIVRQGEALGIKTPVNAYLTDLIKSIEESYSFRVRCVSTSGSQVS